MVGEEVRWLSYADVANAGTRHGDKRARDLRLDVAVIPGKPRADNRAGIAGGLKEEVGIAKEGEGGIAVGIDRRTHVQELLSRAIYDRALQVCAKPGAEDAFIHAGLRTGRADAGQCFFQLANGLRCRVRIAGHVDGG